jgi:hypothetical protein
MTLEVQGLTAMLRDAKASLARAKAATGKLGTVSHDLANTLMAVEAMTAEIEKAHGELRNEMAGSNI